MRVLTLVRKTNYLFVCLFTDGIISFMKKQSGPSSKG